ncbi:hypothetical protein BJ965_003768 [Streptomyces luteogriseus]|uniref:Uncharacterized protein n=2 Tax=Streptomyces luteogriseus TaxID=68233 RepID=A0A7W7DN90_9ACTN|nr:hypothetical protein [Streptomyces luteogriseus]
MERGGMDAYDEGSNARHGPDAPRRPAPPAQRSAPADSAAPDVSPGPELAPDVSPGPELAPDVSPGPELAPDVSPGPELAPDVAPAPPAPVVAPAPPGSWPPGEPRTGIAALSPRYQVGVALALAVVAIGVCVHIGMTFLHVAPANTVTRAHGEAVDDWIYPEFEQNWKLFAPNPLQQNISIQVRAGVRGPDGMTQTTGWYDLSAEDGRAIDGNLLPSHTQQNELRRAWDFFVATHDSENRPVGLRGSLSESYLRRIMVLRLGRDDAVRAATGSSGVIERVQVRSRTSNVPPPEWSREKVSTTPSYRELPWWRVPQDEARGGVR